MLSVINDAWVTLTLIPGTRDENRVILPKGVNITAFGATLNLIRDDKFELVITVIKRLVLSVLMILPTVVLFMEERFTTCITNACDWGGMLLVMAAENDAFMVIPRCRLFAEMKFPP